ncbi:hypothetical protein Tco_0491837 [Tanacetum coccineum]
MTVDDPVIPEEPASSTGTLSSLQHLAKDFSFGDQFFNDKPPEANNEKATADTKAESMVILLDFVDANKLGGKIRQTWVQTVQEKEKIETGSPITPPGHRPHPPSQLGSLGDFRSLAFWVVLNHNLLLHLHPTIRVVMIYKHACSQASAKTATSAEIYSAMEMHDTRLKPVFLPATICKELHMDDDTTADEQAYSSSERDFKYLYPSDFEDLYLLNLQDHLNHLSPAKTTVTSLPGCHLWAEENLVIRQTRSRRDFRWGWMSYQRQS